MRNVLLLAAHDLATAFKNKTLLLILFVPCFVFVSLQLIDTKDTAVQTGRIGLLQGVAYPQTIPRNMQVTWLPDEAAGERQLKKHAIDGLLVRSEKAPHGLALRVLKRESLQTLSLVQQFSVSTLQEVQPLHQGGMQQQTMPTWILMVVLLVGFIVLPTQVAEEKEKKLLLALLQTPITEVEWLTAKVITGMALVSTAVLLLHLLGQFAPAHPGDYLAVIIAGSFCFSAYGIFLGLLCRNQSGARTLGVVFYLPHLLPSALADVSQQLTAVAPLLPSYPFYISVQSILLEDGRLSGMTGSWLYLLLVGGAAFALSIWLIRRRWLMA